MNDDEIYKLAFNFLPKIGAVNTRNLISYCGGVREVFKAKKSTLLKIPGIGEKKVFEILNSDALIKAEEEFKVLNKEGIQFHFYLDDGYPSRLKHFQDAPVVLYYQGNFNFEHQRTVAIVGTRKPSHYGINQCEQLIADLKVFDVQIISGLAYGVDTTSHRKCLDENIETVAVLGSGLGKVYPATNYSLSRKMLQRGGIISEFPIYTKPDRENFPKRNRIISALSDVIVVIESAIKGGSMITALYANDQNKDVFAVPGKNSDEMSAGCNFLIKTNQAHLLNSAKDIAYIMRWDQKTAAKQLELQINLDNKEEKLIDILKQSAESIDILMYKSGLKLSEVTSTLLNLEFKGIVKSLPGKKYILA